MGRQTFSIVIHRPPADVFTYMDDVAREHEWQPNLRSAEQDPPGPTVVGSRKRYVSRFMGRELSNTYVVKELEPGRRIVYQTERGSTVDSETEIVWEPDGASTKVTMSVDAKPRGVLRFVPTALLESTSRAELVATMTRLKDVLETRST